jgi:O-antigen ligase
MVLFLLITVALTVPLIPERIGRLRLLPPPGSTARLMVMACLALGAGGLAFGMIKLATMSGMMGQESQEKNQQQSQAVGGMFVGGRPEILVSSRAVFDSPILGHGSWARDSKYIEMLRDIKSRYGIAYDPAAGEEEAADVIPTHSYLFGAWVWAGILGAVFWLYVLSKVIKSIVKLSLLRPSTMPLYAYLLVRQFWNILFSPFGSTERILTAFVIVIMIELLEVKLPETVTQRIQTVRSTITRPRLWRPSFR